MQEWNRLCLHAIVRSVVIGNMYMAPMFAANQALYFDGSSREEFVEYYVSMANWQLFAFSFVGWLGRACVVLRPGMDRVLSLVGLLMWTFGLLVFTCYAGTISFDVYQITAVLFVSAGGGLYFWCSLDDVIISSLGLSAIHKTTLLLGCLTTVYASAAQLAYTDLARAGYLFVHPLMFMIGAPLSACLMFEEFRNTTACIKDAEEERVSTDKRARSFCAHIAFVLVFGLFKHIPSLTLFVNSGRNAIQKEILLLARSLGTLFGEALFVFATRHLYLPMASSIALPLVVWNWKVSDASQFTRIVLDVLLYGYCVGTFNAWAFHRMYEQWLYVPTKRHLGQLLFILSSALLPGDIMLNLYMVSFGDHILWPAFALSCAMGLLLVSHWILYYYFKQ